LADLAAHVAYLQAEHAAAVAAPLSARKALLVVMLIDAYVDRLFAAQAETGDILEFRRALAAKSPALGLIMALAMQRADGPKLVTEAVEVPLVDYPRLSVEDFMVSLYNGHTVQRVRLVLPDGTRRDMHEVLREAIADLNL
jgi:hypothetical protein